jgi:hypothetical protein
VEAARPPRPRPAPAPPEAVPAGEEGHESQWEFDPGSPIDLVDLERELQAQMAAQARAMRELEGRQADRMRFREEDVQRQIEAIEREVELMREEADRVRALAERQVLVHLGLAPPASRPAVPPPTAPVPAAVPGPPAAPAAPAPATPGPPDVPVPASELPPPPPWRFWFESRAESDASPETEIASVRDALAGGLASHRGTLSALRDEEWITVAVDLLPRLGRRPVHTLQARVRVKDVEERRVGRLAPEAFRKRIEFQEY